MLYPPKYKPFPPPPPFLTVDMAQIGEGAYFQIHEMCLKRIPVQELRDQRAEGGLFLGEYSKCIHNLH